MTNIVSDTKQIIKVHMAGDYQTDCYTVGCHGVTAIVAYDEGDDVRYIPFLMIIKGNNIAARLPAKHLHIYYKD